MKHLIVTTLDDETYKCTSTNVAEIISKISKPSELDTAAELIGVLERFTLLLAKLMQEELHATHQ